MASLKASINKIDQEMNDRKKKYVTWLLSQVVSYFWHFKCTWMTESILEKHFDYSHRWKLISLYTVWNELQR